MESLIYVAIGIAIVFAIWYFLGRKKSAPPKVAGESGIVLPVTHGKLRPDGGMLYVEDGYEFPHDNVIQIICDAVKLARETALDYFPAWPVPASSDCPVMFIKPMATTSQGYPVLLVTPMANSSGGQVPMGEPVMTAGTVFNARQSNVPGPGKATNPFVLLPYQKNWEFPEYLFNSVHYEMEHLIERHVSYEEYLRWSGANDAHPHRPPKAAVGFYATPEAKVKCAGVIEGPAG
jgi:hypothetical protein